MLVLVYHGNYAGLGESLGGFRCQSVASSLWRSFGKLVNGTSLSYLMLKCCHYAMSDLSVGCYKLLRSLGINKKQNYT